MQCSTLNACLRLRSIFLDEMKTCIEPEKKGERRKPTLQFGHAQTSPYVPGQEKIVWILIEL